MAADADAPGDEPAPGGDLDPDRALRGSYVLGRRLFFVLLGLCFYSAFRSFGSQADGLVGSHGIFPAADYLRLAAEQIGPERYYEVPTLLWLGASDAAIHALCGAGLVLSILLVLGFAPRLITLLLWAGYLSLCSVGNVFMGYQWDALLLEAGLLAVLLAPWRLLPPWLSRGRTERRALLANWLVRFLLFRLMFLSGVVKLRADAAWRDLTALYFHYWTQPLPPWTAYFAGKLPPSLHRLSCGLMLAIELVLPFCVFGPRPLRLGAAAGFIFLMVVISATGNYGFFNLLAITFAVLLVDDAAWLRLAPARMRARLRAARGPDPVRAPGWRYALFIPVAAAFFLAAGAEMLGRLVPDVLPRPVDAALDAIAPLRSVNNYGLFARMTRERHEIVLEGSDDGVAWKAYGFRYKPGALDRRPPFMQPHMPRVDWQMWFAALGDCRHNGWFVRMQDRLLHGEPAVLGLLDGNPFPDRPPRYLRSLVYDYHFSSIAALRSAGEWWSRGAPLGDFCPPLTLDGDRLVPAQLPP